VEELEEREDIVEEEEVSVDGKAGGEGGTHTHYTSTTTDKQMGSWRKNRRKTTRWTINKTGTSFWKNQRKCVLLLSLEE
jgi:hypothetical protein